MPYVSWAAIEQERLNRLLLIKAEREKLKDERDIQLMRMGMLALLQGIPKRDRTPLLEALIQEIGERLDKK
jgi:hypothetical protein